MRFWLSSFLSQNDFDLRCCPIFLRRPLARAGGGATSKSGCGCGEVAFCRRLIPSQATFDPSFLSPVRSKEHSALSIQRSGEIACDWISTG